MLSEYSIQALPDSQREGLKSVIYSNDIFEQLDLFEDLTFEDKVPLSLPSDPSSYNKRLRLKSPEDTTSGGLV